MVDAPRIEDFASTAMQANPTDADSGAGDLLDALDAKVEVVPEDVHEVAHRNVGLGTARWKAVDKLASRRHCKFWERFQRIHGGRMKFPMSGEFPDCSISRIVGNRGRCATGERRGGGRRCRGRRWITLQVAARHQAAVLQAAGRRQARVR